MKPPKGIRIRDSEHGLGRLAENGLWAHLRFDCFLPQGDVVFSKPAYVKVGARTSFPAIVYGLPGMRVGGVREVRISPNIAYYERELNQAIPESASLRYVIELLRLSDSP